MRAFQFIVDDVMKGFARDNEEIQLAAHSWRFELLIDIQLIYDYESL